MIRILSEETINKIAAGEVVERPASIVKELIENSLDADASCVSVEVKAAGKNLVRVTDDGVGMDKRDVTLSLERHATSKIDTIEDLGRISTLGFRGEALSSIASVSRLGIVAKKRDANAATKVYAEGGRILEVKETGAPYGTVVEVKNLFFNTPARRKFLKSNTTELTHVVNVFSNYALVYVNCGFKLVHDGECVAEVVSKDTLVDRIGILYGKETADNVVPVGFEKKGIRVTGYVCKPNFTKPNRSGQLIFVNKRPVVSRIINYAVYEGYGTLVPRGRFPIVFLFVDVPADSLDVNVHPTKREVRFGDERLIKEIVTESISVSLQKTEIASISRWSGEKYETVDVPARDWTVAKEGVAREFQERLIAVQTQEKEGFCAVQMNDSYIVSETEEGFDVIDQHAAHERVMYEKIKRDIEKKQSVGQRLLIPVTIELSTGEDEILKTKVQFLKELGFNIEEFGRNSVVVDMVPAILNKVDIAVLIKDILSEIKDMGHADAQENVKEGIVKIMACRAAVKQGDKLDQIEIRRLIQEWRRLPMHYTCPHGRPSVFKMKREELDKKFRRT